jgi:DUF2971 family protein
LRLYHFVNAAYGLDNIRHRRLKISRLDELNDPFEMIAATQSDPRTRLAARLLKEVVGAKLGILCFSRSWTNPVQWSHYADRHRGVCLGFDVDDSVAMPIRYVSKRIPADAVMDRATPDAEVRRIAGALATTKYSHWRYEREVRCWHPLPERAPANGLAFAPFSRQMRLVRVIIGCQSVITRDEARSALGALSSEVELVNTRLAFRTFRVVTQRNSKLWT